MTWVGDSLIDLPVDLIGDNNVVNFDDELDGAYVRDEILAARRTAGPTRRGRPKPAGPTEFLNAEGVFEPVPRAGILVRVRDTVLGVDAAAGRAPVNRPAGRAKAAAAPAAAGVGLPLRVDGHRDDSEGVWVVCDPLL